MTSAYGKGYFKFITVAEWREMVRDCKENSIHPIWRLSYQKAGNGIQTTNLMNCSLSRIILYLPWKERHFNICDCHAVQTARGVSKGTHDFDIHVEVLEDLDNSEQQHFSIGVANEYFDMD
jgi:hypothetical protein